MVIGNPICFSTNSTYFRQFSGRSSYFLIPRISVFHPGSTSRTGFAFSRSPVTGKSVVTFPSSSYPVHTGISSRYPRTSRTVKATSVVPCMRQPYLEATQSNHPDRKSTRLNSSHVSISYPVFCLKKKKEQE